MRTLVGWTMALALVGAATAGAQEGPKPPSCQPGMAIENDDVQVWFQGKKGLVKVTDLVDEATYKYQTRGIVELDADGNQVQRLNLTRALPWTSGCEIEENESEVTITLRSEATIHPNDQETPPVIVTTVYHFDKEDWGIKFDLFVEQWPWAEDAADHLLAFDFRLVTGEGFTLTPAENGVGITDSEGNAVGFVAWAEEATARYEDGSEQTSTVESSTGNDDGEEDDEESESSISVRLAFTAVDGEYAELEMDPELRVGAFLVVGDQLIDLNPVLQSLPEEASDLLRSLL